MLAVLALVVAMQAQDTTQRRPAVPDSLNPDSIRPVLPAFGVAPGPQPAYRRIVFTPADVRWNGAQSLGELLGHVPGVFVVKAGWFGAPELVSYAGQGSASIELYWDGLKLDPLGADSLGFDLGQFDMGLFERIEIEVLPTVLRVYLISDTQRSRRPRTEVSFSTGDASTNGYRIRYLNRYTGGFGIGLGVTFFGTEGPSTTPGEITRLGLWGKATWTPTDRAGIEYQMFRGSLTRETLSPSRPGFTGDLPGIESGRTDHALRAFAATRSDGMGARFDALFGGSSYHDSSGALNEKSTQTFMEGSYRAATWSAAANGRLRDGDAPLEAGARLSFSPLRFLTVTGSTRRFLRQADFGLMETEAGASLSPLSWLHGHGTVRWRRLSDSLLTGSDTTQRAVDWSAGGGISSRMLDLDVTMERHASFEAPPFGYFTSLVPFNSTAGTTTMTFSYRVTPVRWLTLSGWYRRSLEVDSLVSYEPLDLARTRLTFRSMFLPHFRRGAFDVMAYGEIESYGAGIAGYDSTGTAIPLAGKSVFNAHLQFRLVRAIIYWTLRNPGLIRYHHVPGYELVRSQQRFGIIWEFSN